MAKNSITSGSLRLRFIMAVLVWVALGVGGIWFTSNRVFERHIEDMYHEELEVHVRELARLTELDAQGRPFLTRPLSDPRYEVPLSGFYWQVTVPHRPALRSQSMTRGMLDEGVALSPDVAHTVEGGPTGPAITYGLLEYGSGGEPIHVVIATDKSELDEDIAAFTNELVVWLVALGALLLATGLAVISFGLQPLQRLAGAITRLRSGEAEELKGSYPSEIAPLVTDLNEYVRQNTAIVSRARVQAGNLAHSLRTPLAILTDEAEQLVQTDHWADSGKVLLEQAEAMQQQIDYQLARARSAAGARVPGSRAMLPELAMPILNAMRRLHPDKCFTLDQQGGPLVLNVDPVNLAELISILLDNAGKWAREHVRMAVCADKAGAATILVEDDGPGMADDALAKACEVGTRFDEEKSGSGLGLAMARDICEDLGAGLSIANGRKGLRVELRFESVKGDA